MVSLADLPEIIPIIDLKGFVMYPGLDIGFAINNRKAFQAIDRAKSTDLHLVGVVQKNNNNNEYYEVGCAVQVKEVCCDDKLYMARLQGFSRFRLIETMEGFEPIIRGTVKWAEFENDLKMIDFVENFDRDKFIEVAKSHFKLIKQNIDLDDVYPVSDVFLIDFVAMNGNFTTAESQALLEQKKYIDRQDAIIKLIAMEQASSKFQSTKCQ